MVVTSSSGLTCLPVRGPESAALGSARVEMMSGLESRHKCLGSGGSVPAGEGMQQRVPGGLDGVGWGTDTQERTLIMGAKP